MTVEVLLLVVLAALAVYCAFLARQCAKLSQRFEVLSRKFGELVEQRHRAYYTSPNTWIDPDCFECGGEGAPCCDPPTYPFRQGREGVPFGGDGWTTPIPPQSPEQIIARLHELDAEDEANPDPRPLGEPVQIFDKRPSRPSADRLWKALDDMTGQFPVVRPEDPDRR